LARVPVERPSRATESSVCSAIAARFCAPEWATFFDVGDATGGRATRRADAVAMNCWPSRGMLLHGFEVKVSRPDWVREMRDPAKSAAVQRYCDRWWLFVGDDAVVRAGELPATWGLLALRGGRLDCLAEAPPIEPEPWGRPFVAALLRAAADAASSGKAVSALVEARVAEAVEREQRDAAYRRTTKEQAFDRVEAERARLAAALRDFEEASGLRVDDPHGWPPSLKDPTLLGRAVKLILGRGLSSDLVGLRGHVERALRDVEAAVELSHSLPRVEGDPTPEP
jgi:hypothetical protein